MNLKLSVTKKKVVSTDRTIKLVTLFLLAFFLVLLPAQFVRAEGIIMLVGDVLPLKNQVVWRNLIKLTDRKPGENLIIAAAHSRPQLYGEFAQRAFQRYGAASELLPIAEVFQEFSTDYRYLAEDKNLTDRVRASSSIFFVGGLPQRLSKVLFSPDGKPRDLAQAIQQAYASGSMIIGGVPGSTVVSTEVDAIEVLAEGEIESAHLSPGLDLIEHDWFVDQHFFGNGRFAAALVAMHQLGITYGIGVGLDTVAVLHGNTVEVLGNRGVAIVDTSNAEFTDSKNGAMIQGVRLSYLENGDRYDMLNNETVPYEKKANDFQLVPHVDASSSEQIDHFISSQEMFRSGELVRLMFEALDAKSGQSQGYALHHGSRNGFHFRFYTGADSRGWLATTKEGDRFTLANIYLDVKPLDEN